MYILTVTDSNGCKDIDTVIIFVKKMQDIKCNELFVPAAFSPNGDGKNDTLFVRSNCFQLFSLIIYDRWGNKVFISDEPLKGWDGRVNGDESNEAVFVYHLTGTLLDGKPVDQKGTISLIK